MAREFAVIGLGVFGWNVAVNLQRLGHSVLAVDRSDAQVQAAQVELDSVVCADATDEQAVREMNLASISCAVVAIGAESMESSILATTLLRQIGVPQIVARSLNRLHARVLRAVGAHTVVSPEEEMAERLARRLAQPNVLERIGLGQEAEVAEFELPSDFVGQTLIELDVRKKHAVSVVAIRRGSALMAPLTGEERLESGDVLVIIGTKEAVTRLAARV